MRYSSEWIGTSLPLLSLNDAVAREQWQMARWPDPILRRPADPVGKEYFSTNILQIACSRLKQTAIREGAVGLAAQQCGVNARIIYLSDIHSISLTRALPSIMINPSIVWRSPEIVAKVWNEQCLVLPPTFTATVLRDSSVDVVYQTIDGEVAKIRLVGEASRCVQHELDHDRGILLTDHVGLEDLENDLMRSIERLGHEERMALAFSRSLND
jgi:peptide deformylase